MHRAGAERARLLLWADDLVDEGLFWDAAALYQEAAADETDVFARLSLARCQLVTGNAQAALAELDRASNLEATDEVRATVMATRAVALLMLKRPEQALIEAREAMRLNSTFPLPRYVLVWALLDNNDLQAANHEAQALERLFPNLGLVHYAASLVAADAGDLPEAEHRLRRAMEAESEDPVMMLELGTVLMRKGQDRLALELFLDALKLWPHLEPARQGAMMAIDRLRDRLQRVRLGMLAGVEMAGGGLVLDRNETLGKALFIAGAISLIAFLGHAFVHRGVDLPQDARRLLHDQRARMNRISLRSLGMALFISTGITTVFVLATVWSSGGMVSRLVASSLLALVAFGSWRLGRWDPRQVPVEPGTCRCSQFSLVRGKRARRYAARHLQLMEIGPEDRREFWCSATGSRWLGHSLGRRYRLARLSTNE